MQFPIQIFFSRPNGLIEEIESVRKLIRELNEKNRRIRQQATFRLWEWDDRDVGVAPITTAIQGGGQARISHAVGQSSIYLGVMADHFGKGTAREYDDAVSAYRAQGRPLVLFYFKDVPLDALNEQHRKIAEFKTRVWDENGGITRGYKRGTDLAELFRVHLLQLLDQLSGTKYLLTSESPRRIALLRQLGVRKDSELMTYQISTATVKGAATLAEAEEEAKRKAVEKVEEAFRDRLIEKFTQCRPESTIVIGADTLVWCDGQILDTPAHLPRTMARPNLPEYVDRARMMLQLQSGKQIHVLTGLAVASGTDPKAVRVTVVDTRAQIKPVNDSLLSAYLSNADAMWRAGALSLDGQGVALFEGIHGSFSNLVGLPLRDFASLVRELPGRASERFYPLTEKKAGAAHSKKTFAVLSVGDINFDLICNKIEAGCLQAILAPGRKLVGEIQRRVGGTAVNFAVAAQRAGFKSARVVGVIGDDVMGDFIRRELRELGIDSHLVLVAGQPTSVAIVLREQVAGGTKIKDVSLTVTDARQALDSEFALNNRHIIESSDAVHVSGYALSDRQRYAEALEILSAAHHAGALTILDVVVGMDGRWDSLTREEDNLSVYNGFDGFLRWLRTNQQLHNPVQVLVSETRELLRWMFGPEADKHEDNWDFIRKEVVEKLRHYFPVIVLRTPTYSSELVVTPDGVGDVLALDYQSLPSEKRFAYGDGRTARLIYDFLAPRILLASKSPQRIELLKQIVHPDKLFVFVPEVNEQYGLQGPETPIARVQRLAQAKAEAALEHVCNGTIKTNPSSNGSLGRRNILGNEAARISPEPTIELIIGADTEAVLETEAGPIVLEQPQNKEEARMILEQLSGKRHSMLTGVCVIGRHTLTKEKKTIVRYVKTDVEFDALAPDDIDAYVKSGEPLCRAGGYAIQGYAELFIKEIKGSYSNVVGLPLEEICRILDEDFAMPVWTLNKVSGWRKANALSEGTIL